MDSLVPPRRHPVAAAPTGKYAPRQISGIHLMRRGRSGQHTTHSGRLTAAAISRRRTWELMHSKTDERDRPMIEMSRLMTPVLCAAVAAAALGLGVATAGPAAA